MPVIRLTPSSYDTSSGYITVTDGANAYNNTDNNTYATLKHTRSSTGTFYYYLRGFDFSQIDSSWVINSITCKIKASRNSRQSTSSSMAMYFVNDTMDLGTTNTIITETSATIYTLPFDFSVSELKNYGEHFGIRIPMKRTSSSYIAYVYVYGFEIAIDYSLPAVNHTVTYNNSTIYNFATTGTCTVQSSTGTTLLTINESGTKQLLCGNKLMPYDIQLYDNSTLIATLNCNGKYMATNVSIIT